MQAPVTFYALIVGAGLLAGCGQPAPEVTVDRATGRQCFELHLDSLPPGTQYEGVAGVDGERLQVRVMTGAEIETIDCVIDADGKVGLNAASIE
jgi:hypothetical protein